MSKGTTYKRLDGRWESRISIGKDETGKRKYRSFYGKTREEAEYKLMIFQNHSEQEYAVTEMTVKELGSEWMQIMSARLKESTRANYQMKLEKHIIPAFGDKQCCLMKAAEIYTFVEEKLKFGLSARYVSDILILLKSLFRYASREYQIKNILAGFVMPKKEKPDISILTSEQQKNLESYIAENQSLTTLGISISLYMGLRIGELCALKWTDVDFQKRTVTVRKTVQRIQNFDGESKTKVIVTEPKSAKSMREIPIPDCLIPILKAFKSQKDTYVLSENLNPIEPRTLQYRFQKILKNAELPSVNFHSLRHLFATNCVALGFDMKTLSEILGHSSVEITLNRYVHSSMDRKRMCMNLITVM